MNLNKLRELFTEHYGRECTVVGRAPGRVNLIGEHTDYNDGFVLPMALEHSTWVACAAREDDKVRVISDAEEKAQSWTIGQWNADEQAHWTSYVAGVAELLRERGARLNGFDMLIHSDVPVGSGLSSSAALEVGTAISLAHLSGEPIESKEMANLCREAEHKFAGVPCGLMDQFISVMGKEDAALLLDCRSTDYEHIPLNLGDHVVLIVNSGVKHSLAGGEYAKRRSQCEEAVKYFQKTNPKVKALRDVKADVVRSHMLEMDPTVAARALHVTSEDERTLAAADALRKGELDKLGPLLAGSHASLRDNYEVSCKELDMLVEIVGAVDGVVGARMTGGGFGGCIVAIAKNSAVEAVRKALAEKYDPVAGVKSQMFQSHAGAGASIELG